MKYSHVVEAYFGEEEVDLGLKDGLSSLVYYESIYGVSTYTIKATAANWAVWDYVASHEWSPGWLRWGMQSNAGEIWSDWKRFIIPAGKIVYRREYCEAQVSGYDYGYVLGERYFSSVFKDMRISDIVTAIAQRNGLRPEVKPTSGQYTLYQAGMSEAEFIKSVLLPRAIGTDGRSDYVFFVIDGNRLLFGCPDFSKSYHIVEYAVVESEKKTGDSGELEVELKRDSLAKLHGVTTEFRGFDVEKKEPLFFHATDSTVGTIKLAPKSIQVPNGPASVCILSGDNTPQPDLKRRFQERSKSIWSQNHRDRYSVEISTMPLIQASPATVVTLDIRSDRSNNHFLGGNWLCYAVKHVIQKSGISTSLYLQRRESR